MNEHTIRAFDKMQKREHYLRAARDRMGLGKVTREVFRDEEAAILRRFALTDEEQLAYERYAAIQRQRQRKQK